VRANIYFRLFRHLLFVFDKRSNNTRAQYVRNIILVLIFSNDSPYRRSFTRLRRRASDWAEQAARRALDFHADRPVHHAREEKFRGRRTSVSQAYGPFILRPWTSPHSTLWGVLSFSYHFLLIREWSGGFLRYPVYLFSGFAFSNILSPLACHFLFFSFFL
jgi:hypothetical protein